MRFTFDLLYAIQAADSGCILYTWLLEVISAETTNVPNIKNYSIELTDHGGGEVFCPIIKQNFLNGEEKSINIPRALTAWTTDCENVDLGTIRITLTTSQLTRPLNTFEAGHSN